MKPAPAHYLGGVQMAPAHYICGAQGGANGACRAWGISPVQVWSVAWVVCCQGRDTHKKPWIFRGLEIITNGNDLCRFWPWKKRGSSTGNFSVPCKTRSYVLWLPRFSHFSARKSVDQKLSSKIYPWKRPLSFSALSSFFLFDFIEERRKK